MAATTQSFVAAKAGIDPEAAETAVGTILFVIQKEGNATKVRELFQQLPGAADLAQKHEGMMPKRRQQVPDQTGGRDGC